MRKRTKIIIITLSIFFILFFTVGAHFINKNFHEWVKNKPQKYCYETFRGTEKAVSVLIIPNLDLEKPYLKYYNELRSGVEPVLSNDITVKTLPPNRPVYVLGYNKDSLMADVLCYGALGPGFSKSYTRGWVLADALHSDRFYYDADSSAVH